MLKTVIPAGTGAVRGEAEVLLLSATLGGNKPLLVLSISNKELLLIVVELSPILSCALAGPVSMIKGMLQRKALIRPAMVWVFIGDGFWFANLFVTPKIQAVKPPQQGAFIPFISGCLTYGLTLSNIISLYVR
jgi:hypothetical protein